MYRNHLRRVFCSGMMNRSFGCQLWGKSSYGMAGPGYAARLSAVNWQVRPFSAKRLTVYAVTNPRSSAALFWQPNPSIRSQNSRILSTKCNLAEANKKTQNQNGWARRLGRTNAGAPMYPKLHILQ
jgi:hypothetical protein